MIYIYGIYEKSLTELFYVYYIDNNTETAYFLVDAKTDLIIIKFKSQKNLINYIKRNKLKELNWTIETWNKD